MLDSLAGNFCLRVLRAGNSFTSRFVQLVASRLRKTTGSFSLNSVRRTLRSDLKQREVRGASCYVMSVSCVAVTMFFLFDCFRFENVYKFSRLSQISFWHALQDQMSNVSCMSGAAVLLAGREIVCPTHPPFRLKYGGGIASAATCRIFHAGFSCNSFKKVWGLIN